MTEQLQKDVFINEDLRYFQLTNIFFDKPLNEDDIITLKEVFFSINNISQIYFKDTFDLKGIEIVKSVLEISPTMEDSLVEKYILNASTLDKNKLLNMNFSNIDTWFISYKENENSFSTITIDKYREEVNLIDRITSAINTSSSPVEKIMYIYNFCKKLNYKDNASTTLLDILKTKESNKSGYAYVFNELLNTIGIKSFMAESITDNSNSFVNLVKVDDDKYKIHGIYLFDSFSDSISKDEINEKLRGINYNYFLITIPTYLNTIFSDKLLGVASCFTHDYEYDLERLRRTSPKEFNTLLETFDMDFLNIYKKVNDTKKVDDEIKLNIIKNNISEELQKITIENYFIREEKISKYPFKKIA